MTHLEDSIIDDANEVLAIDRRMKQIDMRIAAINTRKAEIEAS